MAGLESFIPKKLGPEHECFSTPLFDKIVMPNHAHLNEMPYCETASYPDFHTKVTSQAFVAWSLHDKNAEMALPPTTVPR